jgi:predicted  nucleic acid-binding Zn-ribbon protein
MAEESILDILIRSSANLGGFAAAEAATGNLTTAVNTQGGALTGLTTKHAAHAQVLTTTATAERDVTKEADSMARALGSAGDQGAKAISRFESLGGVLASSGAMGLGIGAALVGTTALIAGGKAAIDNADTLEKSTLLLTQAYDSQGQSLQNQGYWINQFLDTNRKYIDNQYAARDSIASLVRAGYDQVTVQRIATDALDFAAAKNISYATASTELNLALQGNTRGLRDLGLSAIEVTAIMSQATRDNKELATANKTLTADTDKLAKAEETLHKEEDVLHAKRVVTAADLDVLHQKQKAVNDLTAKVVTDQNALADANGNIATTASDQAKLLDTLEPKLAKARDTATSLTQSQRDLNKSWQDASAAAGGPLAEAASNAINIGLSTGRIIGEINARSGPVGGPTNLQLAGPDPSTPTASAASDQAGIEAGVKRWEDARAKYQTILTSTNNDVDSAVTRRKAAMADLAGNMTAAYDGIDESARKDKDTGVASMRALDDAAKAADTQWVISHESMGANANKLQSVVEGAYGRMDQSVGLDLDNIARSLHNYTERQDEANRYVDTATPYFDNLARAAHNAQERIDALRDSAAKPIVVNVGLTTYQLAV